MEKKYFEKIEEIVTEALIEHGYKLMFKNFKCGGVEIDRVFKDAEGDWVICEIKSMSDWGFLSTRVSEFQKQRLYRARNWLQAYKAPGPVQICYAFYHPKEAELRVYDEIGDEILAASVQWS